MRVDITGLSQQLSFENGDIQNFLNIRLPNGKVILAEVDSEVCNTIVAMSRGLEPSKEAATPTQQQPSYKMESAPDVPMESTDTFSPSFGVEENEDGAVVFGGEDPVETTVQQRLDEAAAQLGRVHMNEAPAKPAPTPHWHNARRAPTVSKDDYGNPVLTGADVADPGEVSGTSDEVDEVQQV